MGVKRGVGQPPKPEDEKRKNRNFRASKIEWEQIQENAKKAGMDISEFIRYRTLMK